MSTNLIPLWIHVVDYPGLSSFAEPSLVIGTPMLPAPFAKHLSGVNKLVRGLIVWSYAGQFRLITTDIIKNAYVQYTAYQTRSVHYPPWGGAVLTAGCIRWEQGLDISPEVARALTADRPSEEFDKGGSTGPAADPDDEG